MPKQCFKRRTKFLPWKLIPGGEKNCKETEEHYDFEINKKGSKYHRNQSLKFGSSGKKV